MIVAPGATSQSFTVQIVDDSGLAVTGLVAATFPATSYERVAEASASITLSDLAAINSAWSAGGVKEVGGGYYRLDVPDAAFATASKVRLIGEATGKHLLYPPITVDNLSAKLAAILSTALTESVGGQLAGAFKKFFDVGTPTGTVNSLPGAAPAANGGLPTVDANNNVHGLQVGTGTGQLNTSGGKVPATVAAADVSGNLPANVVQAAGTAWNSGAITSATFAEATGLWVIRANTAQGGASGSITLDAAASPTNNIFNGAYVFITSGTGASQAPRLITGYNGATKVATVAPAWAVAPDATTHFVIQGLVGGAADVEQWLAVAPNALQSGRVDSYVGSTAAALVFNLTGSITGNLTGNVTGSVGSVSGNVVGSVGSISGVTFPSNFGTLLINASGHISRVTLADTITTYTGNIPQSGDSYPGTVKCQAAVYDSATGSGGDTLTLSNGKTQTFAANGTRTTSA